MTSADIIRQRAKGAIFALVLLAAPMADLAAAQDRPGPAVELAAGWVGFADDGIVSEVSDRNSSIYTDQTTVTW